MTRYALIMAVSVLAASAEAQRSKPRVGYAAPPPEQAQPRPQTSNGTQVYGSPTYIITGAPYVVLNDGSVLANFGYGYERVLRQCASQNAVSPTTPSGRDALGRIGPPPGIAALQSGSRGQLGGTMPAANQGACYRVGRNGFAEAVRQ